MFRTPEEWRDMLLTVLQSRNIRYRLLRSYYDGEHGLPTAPSTTTDLYRRLAQLGETNMCALVVDTVNERLRPTGIRLSQDAAGDLDIWRRVWQANSLDADWPTAQEEALKVGRCPVLVWPNDPEDRTQGVSVTVEDPDETLVAYEPGSRRKRAAALKVYTDGETEFCTVYVADEVVAWTREASDPMRLTTTTATLYTSLAGGSSWVYDPDNSGLNPFGRVPVVELVCKASVKGVPQPELSRPVLMIQDRINKTMFDTVVAAEYGAFPQRYTIGIEIQRDEQGLPVNPLTVGPNRVWNLANGSDGLQGSIGQLAPFPLTDLLNLCDASIKHLASITRTPVYYLLSGLTNVGADSIRAAETGHVAKIMGHQTRFGESAEEIFRLALIHDGVLDPPSDIEMEWAPPETRSPAELADASLKMSQAGYPFEAIARYMGSTPTEIARILAERATQVTEASSVSVVRATETAPPLPVMAPPMM